jgi:hypothetical protein
MEFKLATWRDGSGDKGTCHQVLRPGFNSWSEERTPMISSVVSAWGGYDKIWESVVPKASEFPTPFSLFCDWRVCEDHVLPRWLSKILLVKKRLVGHFPSLLQTWCQAHSASSWSKCLREDKSLTRGFQIFMGKTCKTQMRGDFQSQEGESTFSMKPIHN